MLLATPLFFSSCEEDGTLLKYRMEVTVTNDFTKVVEAINNGTLKNEQAINMLVAAIDKMNADQQTKLQVIMEAITSVNNTLNAKLAAIEAAMRAQTLSMENKLALIEQVLSNVNTTLEVKIGAIEAALKEQTISMEAKMDLIRGILSDLNTTLEVKLGAIEATMKEQSIALAEKLALIEQAVKDQTTSFDTKMELIIKAITSLPDYSEKLAAIETAIKAMPDYSEQLKAIEKAMKDMNTTLTEKLAILESIQSVISDNGKKLEAIGKAIGDMPDYTDAFNNIKTEIANLVKAVTDGKKSQKDALDEIAKKIEKLKAAAGIEDSVEYVDLGLPSGNLWAKCNLGASSPEQYGDYYAWGETKPKQEYTYPNHKWYKEGAPSLGFTKYNNEDGKLTLEDEDDAVIQNLGKGWRTPSLADFRELTNQKYTTIEKTTLNGVAGYQIKSKKNGKSIFIPFAGFRNDKPKTREISSSEEVAICMTNQRRIDNQVFNCWTFAFEQDRVRRYGKRRPDGISIRPVKGPGVPIPTDCVDLGLASGLLWAKYNIGTTEPTKPGDYYAWGETSTKKEYYSTNYKHFKAKYNIEVLKYNEKDGKTVLDLNDDAARANLGVGYRIPTKEDWEELLEDCKWEAVTTTLSEIIDPSQKKVIVRWKVTGPSGNSIVLPMTSGFKADGWGVRPDYDIYYTTANLYPPADELSDKYKYQKAVALTWPMFAEETSSEGIEEPSFKSIFRDFGVVVRPVFDLYSNK
mgnify:CR=1 FL=1